jgi:hypothetical protein
MLDGIDMSFARWVSGACSLAAVLVLAGCSGSSLGSDLTAPPPDGTDPPDPPTCTTIAAVCDPNDDEVASEAACRAGGYQYCYSRASGCGGSTSTIWCGKQRVVRCGAVPTCDGGDKQVTACPGLTGVTCYDRTACGTTILCMHEESCKGLPACDPGDAEVIDIDTCSKPGASCYSRTKCSFTIWCEKK